MTKRKITTEDALRMMQNLKQSSGGGVSSLEDFGVNASAAELNHVKGVTSNIQEQLNGKASALDIYPVYIFTQLVMLEVKYEH